MLIFEYEVFEQNQMSSLYLDNYGDSLTGVMAFFAIYLLCGIKSLTKTKEELMSCRIGKIYVGIFGLFISTLTGGIQSQILYSVIQLLRPDLFADRYSRISYFTAYLLFSVTLGLQTLCFFTVNTILNKKMKIIKAKRLRNRRIRSNRRALRINNPIAAIIPPSTDDRWKEMKYAMFFDPFKETSKHSFLFGYWITLYDIIYILLIFSLQNEPVLQCLLVLILVVIYILVPATIKPFKEKSVAFLFFFNFTCVLILAIINLALAIQANVTGAAYANDQVGWAIFSIILINSSTNIIVGFGGVIYQLVSLWKDRMKRKKNSRMSTTQQVESTRPNQAQNEFGEHNRRRSLQDNNQSNLSHSRNADVSRQSETQRQNHQNLSQFKKRGEAATTINLEQKKIVSNPQNNRKNHRKINLKILRSERIQRNKTEDQIHSRTTRKN